MDKVAEYFGRVRVNLQYWCKSKLFSILKTQKILYDKLLDTLKARSGLKLYVHRLKKSEMFNQDVIYIKPQVRPQTN